MSRARLREAIIKFWSHWFDSAWDRISQSTTGEAGAQLFLFKIKVKFIYASQRIDKINPTGFLIN